MKIRRLTEKGLKEFTGFLDAVNAGQQFEIPYALLTDDDTSESIPADIDIEEPEFKNRFDAAKYLEERLSGASIPDLEHDKGIWAWLSLFYFKQLCAQDKGGNSKPGELARWIPATDNFRKYYRHLLAGPYRVFRAHRDSPERAMALLDGPVSKPGEMAEQLASSQEFVTNPAVVELATKLYLDTEFKRKKGSGGKGPGSPRRLAALLNQWDLTFDLYSMSTSDLSSMLPKEFSRFQPVEN
jgi:hypothetical protein